VRILEARGAVVDREELPGMALDLARLAQTARPAPRELRIEPVASAAALDDFAVAFGAAYHFPPAALESVVAAIAAYGLDGDVRHFVGYAARRPVCAASIVVRDGVGGLYDVATVAAARGRGYGAAVSAHALRAAGDAGAHGAILHASPEGMPIYERLGFEVVGAVQTVETHL
jgi:GNAT superfamily N-acetyltransferase